MGIRPRRPRLTPGRKNLGARIQRDQKSGVRIQKSEFRSRNLIGGFIGLRLLDCLLILLILDSDSGF